MSAAKINTNSLLFVTHINFWERNLGSRMRLYYMLNYLSEYFLITVIYIAKRREGDRQKLKEIGYHETVLFLDELDESEYDKSEIENFLNTHTVLKNFYDDSLYGKMRTFLNNHSFENVIIEYIHLSYFLPLFKGDRIFLDSIDIMNIRNRLFKKNNQKHWINISEQEELDLFAYFDKVIAIQKNEYHYLKDHHIDSVLVPFSLSIPERIFRNQMKNIVFIGGDTDANIEAINWFIAEVWPLFSCFGLQLKLCGDISSTIQESNEVLREKNIVLMGRIDNLNSFYQNKADVVINPVHFGGGLKIKNAEALAYGLPLITTTEGSSGLESGINSAFLLANSADEWVESLIILSLSASLRESFSENAYHFAQNYFGDEACYRELIKILSEGTKAGNGSIDSTNKKKESLFDAQKEEGKRIGKRINHLRAGAKEIKRQMYQYQESLLLQELRSYTESINMLIATSAIRHLLRKISRYKDLARSYEKYRYITYSIPFGTKNQGLAYTFREKIEEMCAVDLRYHPWKKIKVYKRLVAWYSEVYLSTAAPDKD